MNTRSNSGVLTLCALIVPAGFVFGTRLIGSGPANAFAEKPVPAEAEFDFPEFQPPVESRLPERIKPVQSPFYFESIEVISNPVPRVKGQSTQPEPDQSRGLPPVSVTSILPSARNPLAIIDGKPRRVGDTLPSGWTVVSINGEDSTVSLIHTSGKRVRAGLKNNP